MKTWKNIQAEMIRFYANRVYCLFIILPSLFVQIKQSQKNKTMFSLPTSEHAWMGAADSFYQHVFRLRAICACSILFFIFSFGFLSYAQDGSKGMAVEPGEMVLSGIVPGTTYDLAVRGDQYLTIFNESDKDCLFSLVPAIGSDYGLKLKNGYQDIPDPTWLILEKTQIKVAANSCEKIKMKVLIPDQENNYAKKWRVIVVITAVPDKADTIGLRLTPAYYLETAAKTRV